MIEITYYIDFIIYLVAFYDIEGKTIDSSDDKMTRQMNLLVYL